MKQTLLIVLTIFSMVNTIAQKNPVEVLAGDKATNVQFNTNKKFSENSKFGYFAIVNFNMPYDKKDPIFKYHIIQANVTYSLTKHIKVYGGGFSNKIDYGASAGLLGTFPFKNSFLLVSNRHSLVENYVSELVILYEFRPKLSEKLNLYSRVQVMAETDFKEYKRGFQMLRLGLSSNQFSYGIAATFDQFGKTPITYENTGLFVRAEL